MLLWFPPKNPHIAKEILKNAHSLKWIHSWFVGVDSLHPFLQQHLIRESIVITNSKGAFSASLTEYVLAIMLHFTKQILRIVHNSQNRIWDEFMMGELRGKTIGFVGFGEIAQSISRAAKFLDMRVIALRRRKQKMQKDSLADKIYFCGSDDENAVYEQSDFVICTLPGTSYNFKIISRAQFRAMKTSAVFISIGRGTVVDEEALAQAIAEKQLGGAALDVFHDEPLPPSSPLWNLPNVLITAHNADWVESNASSAAEIFKKNLIQFLNGAETETDFYSPINKENGY